MLDFTERGTDLESTLATFDKPVSPTDLKNNQDVPLWVAIRTRLANQQLQASLISAVHLVAQMKVTSHPTHSALSQLMDEIISDWCRTQVPDQFPPRLHWSSMLEQLGLLANRYSAGSVLHDAVFDLSHRVLNRAQELSRLPK